MKYEEGELSHLCQRVLIDNFDSWPMNEVETEKINIPEGAGWMVRFNQYMVTDFDTFVLSRPAIKAIMRVEESEQQ